MGSGARGPSQRQLRVGEVIRQRFAEVLARDDLEAEILKKTSITVTEVRITPDLRQASVYVMPLGGTHLSEIVDKLNVEAPRLKKAALGGLHL
ncbi:MAG: ribosome-binding factor A, partial [Pseudomonadota bacterium]|nr:ribosome-binding factor A [Pseudomonadota bacterium]